MSVFVDTSTLVALLDREDTGHAASRDAWIAGIEAGEGFLTHNYVTLETIAVAQRRYGMDAVRVLVDAVLPLIHLEWVTEQDHAAGLTAMLTADRRQLSLVDCISFALMRRLGVRAFLALDPHFAEQGFEPYRPPTTSDD